MLNASVPVLGRVPPSQQYKRHRRPYHEHHDIPASVIFIILSSLVVKDKDGRPQMSLGQASPWNVIFPLQCFDTVGRATGRASGL